jgi:hypothetical protein
MSPIKEPKFFLTDGPPPASGGPEDALTYREHVWQRDRYEALFDPAPPGTLRSESTPLYLYDRPALLERVLGEDFGDWLAPRTRSGGLVGARPAGQPGPGQERPPRVIAAPLVAAIPALAIFPVYTLVSRATLTEHGTDHESTSADGGQHVPSALGAKGQTGGNARRLCRGSVRGCSGGLYGARRREQRAGPGASGFRLSAPDCQPDAADRGSVLRDRSPVLHSEGDAELV